jgi:hypothetical protein
MNLQVPKKSFLKTQQLLAVQEGLYSRQSAVILTHVSTHSIPDIQSQVAIGILCVCACVRARARARERESLLWTRISSQFIWSEWCFSSIYLHPSGKMMRQYFLKGNNEESVPTIFIYLTPQHRALIQVTDVMIGI